MVTGGNKGLGKEISRQLAALGMTVLLTARDRERGAEAAAELARDGADVRFVHLDVTVADTVVAAATFVDREFGQLHLLVNNAGVTGITRGERTPLDQLTVEQLRSVMDTNFTGAFAVTQALLPLLRKANGRVLNLTSALATFARAAASPASRPDLLPYLASKAALNMMSVVYAGLCRDEGVTVYSVSPGYVATDMNNFAGTKTVEEGAGVIVRFATADAGELPAGGFLTAEGVAPW
jgi:NAD(P)-dependent dehydrogenase (short-subunit alcohol dehydrogenase family)